MNEFTPYLYTKGADAALDAQFAAAQKFGKVRVGADTVFWRSGLRLYAIPLSRVQRIFRRVIPVFGKLCCGGRNFDIERLVLVLTDGTEVDIHVGDDVRREAEQLLKALQDAHPELEYGKP